MKKEASERKFWIRVASAIFFAVAIAHFFRLIFRWDFVVGSWQAPLYLSLIVLIVIGFLSVKLYNFTCGK